MSFYWYSWSYILSPDNSIYVNLYNVFEIGIALSASSIMWSKFISDSAFDNVDMKGV